MEMPQIRKAEIFPPKTMPRCDGGTAFECARLCSRAVVFDHLVHTQLAHFADPDTGHAHSAFRSEERDSSHLVASIRKQTSSS